MVLVREYDRADSRAVGVLIADTFGDFNLAFASPEEKQLFLGPFQHARSADPEHREAIARAIQSEVVLVAELAGQIVGVLRGRPTRLGSLFVRGDLHRQGIGHRLVERFERQCVREGSTHLKVAATLFAVPFYLKMGYKRSTGVRLGRSFDGRGLPYQPMKKVLCRR